MQGNLALFWEIYLCHFHCFALPSNLWNSVVLADFPLAPWVLGVTARGFVWVKAVPLLCRDFAVSLTTGKA